MRRNMEKQVTSSPQPHRLRGLRYGFVSFVVWICFAAAAQAQHSVPELEAQLARTRERLAAADLDAASRIALLRQCDDVQRRLIAAAPADDRLPTWLADRAACALDLAGEDGADVAVLFGVPTAAQRRAVHSRAREGLELAQRADKAATQVVARLEAQLVDRRNPEQAKARAAGIEASLHTLIDIEQGERIPQIRAIARLLSGVTSTEPADREDVQTAAKELAAIGGVGAQQPVHRRVYLGIAFVHAACVNPDRADDLLAAAVAQLTPIAGEFRVGATTAENGPAIRARLGLLRAGKEAPTRPALANAMLEREIQALEAESRAAGLFDRAQHETGARPLLVASAIRVLLESLAGVGTDDPMRLRVYDKIAAALPSGVPLDRLPPEATFARAISRIREGAGAGSTGAPDSLAREDAIALLDSVVKRADADAGLRSQARWEKAVILGASGDARAEVDALAAFIAGEPKGGERSPQAARRIADLFAKQSSGGALPEAWRAKSSSLRDALAILVRTDPSNADRWRQESIRLCIADLAATAGATDADFERGLMLLEGAPAASELDAHTRALADAIGRALDQRVAAARAKKEWESIVPPASRALAWAKGRDAGRVPQIALVLGEARVGIDDPRALETLGELAVGAEVGSRYRLALARAQRLAGQDAKALATLHGLADGLEGAPGSATRDGAYWAAWAEMLTILQSQNSDGARSADIRVQIKRLELLDAKLGGPPHADRIRAIRAAVGE